MTVLPEKIGPYTITREIGRGGMGIVYLATTRSSPSSRRGVFALESPGFLLPLLESVILKFSRTGIFTGHGTAGKISPLSTRDGTKMTRRSFHSKILGVTAKSEDGYSQQRLIKRLRVGTVLKLVRDPGNRDDPNAIEVCTRKGKMLGYLNRNLAEELSPQIDSGTHIECVVSELTGGGWFFKRTRGVNIELTVKG